MYTVFFSFNLTFSNYVQTASAAGKGGSILGYLEFNCFTPTTERPVSLSEVFDRNVVSIFSRKL